jgi:hypothetical protein
MTANITLFPITEDDVPKLSSVGHRAFATDRHTLMKMSEKHTDDMNTQMPQSMYDSYMSNPRIRMIKAVDEDTGEIVGFVMWATWNFDGSKVVSPHSFRHVFSSDTYPYHSLKQVPLLLSHAMLQSLLQSTTPPPLNSNTSNPSLPTTSASCNYA